jgi:hypothetical protein
MKKEQFYNFEGENTILEFTGEEENEFDGFLGAKAKQKRKSTKTPEELEAIRLKKEMLRAFMKEGLALGYSKRDARAFAIKKYNEFLQQQPQSTINFFGMIDDEEENEFDEFLGIGAGIAAIKGGKRLKELTNEEEARMAQIEQDLRNSGALPGVAKVKSKATILLEIQKRKNNEVDKLKKDLIAAKKANWTNAGGRAKRLWEENRQKQLEQESLADSQAVNQNLSQQAQSRLGALANIKLPKTPKYEIQKGLLAKLAGMKFASNEAKDAYIASQTQGETKNLNAGALPESPVADGVDAVDESTSTMVTPTVGSNTNEGSEKPNYMLWTGIGLAVLTLGFLAYRKYYTK